MWQFGWVYRYQSITNSLSEPLSFWPFFGNRETVRIRLYYRGRRAFCGVEEVRNTSFRPRKTTNTKGELHEKASLNCIGGKWIDFRPRATF